MGNIVLRRIHRFYQVELPRAGPFFDLFLSRNGVGYKVMNLKPDKCFHVIFTRKTRLQIVLVFIKTICEIACNAGLKRAISLGCENVDVTLAHKANIAP